jgi:D-3-phosphoglycerate dehydrogenase
MPMSIDTGKCRVLVTSTTFGMHDPGLRSELERTVGDVRYNPVKRPLTASELAGLVAGVDGWIAGLDVIDAYVIAAADRLKVIARYGVGIDRVDLTAATRRGIVVANTPGANSVAVAELTIGLMLALARRLCQADRAVRSGQWPRVPGVGLAGKTVGLVGFGSVGREVARRLTAFGCRVVVSDPHVRPEVISGCGAGRLPLDELLPASDFVCLHAAATPATAGMVDGSFLRKMKPGAFLVNTARGELIDEAALGHAMESGRLRGAALDCFRQEPPGADHPLLRLPQVIATPHTGAHTDEAVNAMGRMALDACLAVLRGQRPVHVVNPDVYARMEDL